MHYSTVLALLPAVLAAPALEARQNIPGYWQGNCFDVALDHGNVDRSHDELRNWAASGPIITTTDHNLYSYFQVGDVIAYACTDDHDGSNYFNQGDVDAAYYAMDKACPLYQSGWAIYVEILGDGSHRNTGKIIGKDIAGHPVCQGSNGN